MARITVEDCLEKVTNRFQLAILAAKRAKQLLNGSNPKITDSENKSAVLALREVASGDVRIATEEELEKLKEENVEVSEVDIADELFASAKVTSDDSDSSDDSSEAKEEAVSEDKEIQ